MKELKEYFNNRKTLTLSIIAIVALIAIVSGATFAYFATTKNLNGSTPVNTQTASSMYSFSAIANETIEFNLSATEMSEANASTNVLKSDSANIYVELSSASDNETTTCTYDVQWAWDSTDKYTESDVELPYTKDGKTYPYELSVVVDGENETDLSALTWTDNKAIVASGLEIVSTSKTPVKLTHLIEVKSYNIPVHQAKLYNKNFKAHLEVVNNSCKASNAGKAEEINQVLASYISEKSGETINQEDNGENYTGEIVNENGIRYEGKNPNNYVQFNNELWRVIGVFDENTHGRAGEQLVKLIRTESIGDYKWDSNGTSNWNNASLKRVLNINYYNNDVISGIKTEEARNMIQPIYWKIGGYSSSSVTANFMYNKERGNLTSGSEGATAVTTEKLSIGLMYPSDYGYAVQASNCARSKKLSSYGSSTPTCHTENWLWNSSAAQLTISPYSGLSSLVWIASSAGHVYEGTNALANVATFPVLYLKAGVKITSGKGTKAVPYILDIGDSNTEKPTPVPGPTSTIAKLSSGTFSEALINAAGQTNDNVEYIGENYTGAIVNENGIRYEGMDPNNYVNFNDEIWRIIGVFDENTHGRAGEQLVKLIRVGSIGTHGWDEDYSMNSKYDNNWNTATLKNRLNTSYYNNDGMTGIKTEVARNMIQPIQWKIGGHDSVAITASEMYEKERGTIPAGYEGATAVTTETLPIGLMYPSDYGYAVQEGNCARTTTLGKYGSTTCSTKNWLFYSEDEWTLTPNSGESHRVWSVDDYGYVEIHSYDGTPLSGIDARPVLYLKAGVKIASGNGTKILPYNLTLGDSSTEKPAPIEPGVTIATLQNGVFYNSLTLGLNKETNYIDSDSTEYKGIIVNENGLRFEGKNPNNYVQFNDELWRIIGVFNEETHGRRAEQLVKLIRAEALPQYYKWDSGNVNNWNNATLKTLLNTNYYNNSTINACSNSGSTKCTAVTVINEGIKTELARNMIQPIHWKIGGHDTNQVTASEMYEKERGTTLPTSEGATAVTTENLPIGLMYPSDYGFAVHANDCTRTRLLDSYSGNLRKCSTENWLLQSGKTQYLLSPRSGDSSGVWYMYSSCSVGGSANGNSVAVPVLYLKQNVQITGGSGTKIDPYTLSYTA